MPASTKIIIFGLTPLENFIGENDFFLGKAKMNLFVMHYWSLCQLGYLKLDIIWLVNLRGLYQCSSTSTLLKLGLGISRL